MRLRLLRAGYPRDGEHAMRVPAMRHVSFPRQWELWSQPRQLCGYVLVIEAITLLTTAVTVFLLPVTRSDWIRFAILAGCAVVHVEVTRSVERTRHIVNGAGPSMNTDAVWCLAAVLALPVGLASGIVVVVFAWSWLRVWRGRRPLYRWVFSAATVLIGTQAAAVVLLLVPGPHPEVSTSLIGLAVATAAAALRWLLNFGLVSGAIMLASPNIRAAQLVENIGERILEVGAFGLGLVAAYLLVQQPILLGGIVLGVLVMHRIVLLGELRKDAHTDAKTELSNAAWWNEIARRAVERASASGAGLAVLMLDLDHFKAVNDLYGHVAGDQALKCVGEALRAEIRDVDTACRWGGEEFAVLLPGADAAHVQAIAERIRLRVHGLTVDIDSTHGPDTLHDLAVSIGGACYPGPNTNTVDKLLLAADTALYQAKSNGRNQVRISPMT
jgi:diguanylate cyclase (GGDEF)-like protein